MSITMGIYDFFAYVVPGLIYLFLLNDFSSRMEWVSFDLMQVNSQISIGTIGVVALAAYIAGNVFDVFAHWFCFSLLTRKNMSETVLQEFKKQYPELNVAYRPKDYHMLFVLLRARNPTFTQTIDRFEANSILLKNVSFASLLFAVIRLPDVVISFSTANLALFLASLVICWLAFRASKNYHTWFFLDVFQASLDYGLSIPEVLAAPRPKS